MKRGSLLLLVVLAAGMLHADELELLTGTTFEGTLVEETDQHIRFKVVAGRTSAEMTFRREKVHAITVDGRRRVITERAAAGEKPKPRKPKPAASAARARKKSRTKAQVEKLIAEAGKTNPEWWDDVPLDYPKTLLLHRPKPTGGWNPNVNVSQYILSTINPNPSKWRGAGKFLMHVLEVNRDDPEKTKQTMRDLAHVHGSLLRDYARGAYWLRKVSSTRLGDRAKLAYFYVKLGNKGMARSIASGFRNYRTRSGGIARLWMLTGDTKRAVAQAEKVAERWPAPGYLVAGDACRRAGKYKQAQSYYQKALTSDAGRDRRSRPRARAGLEAAKAAARIDLKKIADGTYNGDSPGFRGQLHVSVTVKAGRIESVQVTQHRDDWFLSSIFEIPEQIVEKQGIKGVDAVTGATVTSEAIINAAARALAGGVK